MANDAASANALPSDDMVFIKGLDVPVRVEVRVVHGQCFLVAFLGYQ